MNLNDRLYVTLFIVSSCFAFVGVSFGVAGSEKKKRKVRFADKVEILGSKKKASASQQTLPNAQPPRVQEMKFPIPDKNLGVRDHFIVEVHKNSVCVGFEGSEEKVGWLPKKQIVAVTGCWRGRDAILIVALENATVYILKLSIQKDRKPKVTPLKEFTESCFLCPTTALRCIANQDCQGNRLFPEDEEGLVIFVDVGLTQDSGSSRPVH